MKRYDLRHLHENFYDRMMELIDEGLVVGEVGIFLFEIGDFSPIQKSADLIKASGHELMNSIKFNEVDWTIVVKKLDEETAKKRAEAFEKAKREAEEAAAKAAAEAEAKAKAAEAAKAAKAKPKADATPAKAESAPATSNKATQAKPQTATKTETVTKPTTKEPKPALKETTKGDTQKKESPSKAADHKVKTNTDKSEATKDEQTKPTKPTKSEKTQKGEDLTVIKGIGKVYMEKLNNEGIYTIEDVAAMNEEQIQMMEEKYSFKGDFKESVADAKRLLKKKAK